METNINRRNGSLPKPSKSRGLLPIYKGSPVLRLGYQEEVKTMPNTIGKIPEFEGGDDSTKETGVEEVKEAPQETGGGEKETTTEPPAEKEPASETGVDTEGIARQIQGLNAEREKLLEDIKELRGQRRDLKKGELFNIEQKIEEKADELKDLHPDDVATVEKILKAKGYVTKDESNKMFYDAVKQEELNKFLEKYPEYKPENDPNDVHWSAVKRELGYYRMPDNPHLIGEVLERVHRAISKPISDRDASVKKRQVEVASTGAGGVQRSSSGKSLPSRYREELSRGGWSEEEIRNIENKLT